MSLKDDVAELLGTTVRMVNKLDLIMVNLENKADLILDVLNERAKGGALSLPQDVLPVAVETFTK